MHDDLDEPFGRRFYDRADQRENRDEITEVFVRCKTLREMAEVCLRRYHVPAWIVTRILRAPATKGVRAMNLVREARKGRPAPTSAGSIQSQVRPERKTPPLWEV